MHRPKALIGAWIAWAAVTIQFVIIIKHTTVSTLETVVQF